jgi:tetratricopeptide (TPR) repeat protein
MAEAESLVMRGDRKRGAAKIVRDLLDLEEQEVVEMLQADAQWTELQPMGPKAQKDRIAVSARCKTPAFARLLLGELRSSSSWEEAERLASLVAASIHAMDPGEFGPALKNDLRGETMIELANSRRRAAKWKRSEDALAKAEAFLAAGTGDRRLQARLLVITATLDADRGRIESAVAGFTISRKLYESLGERALVARTLVQIADTLSEPDPRAGLSYLDEANSYFVAGDPLILNAKLLRVDCLVWTGRHREASRWLLGCERPKNGRMLIRYRFIEARLLHSLGYRREAERLLNDVVTDDLENELFKDALLDLLYLLKVHISEGDREKATAVCRRALDEPVLAQFSHDQPKALWRQILAALETPAFDAAVLPLLNYT